MYRVLIAVGLLFAMPLAVLAQDDEACEVAQSDMTVTVAPEQTLVWRVSGSAKIIDATAKLSDLPATATSNARVRSEPVASGDTNVLGVIPAGAALDVFGRSEAGDWLYIAAPENSFNATTGWVSTQVARVEGDTAALPVISPDSPAPLLPAFQAVTIPAETCSHSEMDGGLVQAVGDDYTLVVVNGVDIMVRGTVFVRPTDDALTVNVIDGLAIARGVYVPTGVAAIIMPDAEPTLTPYDWETLAWLPLQARFGSDFAGATVAPALADADIDVAVRETFAPHGLLDGFYQVTVTEFVETKPDTYGVGYCFSRGTALNGLYVTDAVARGIDAPLTILSMREFVFDGGYEDDHTGCRVKHYAKWQSAEQ